MNSLLHFNSCVYELVITEGEDTPKALFKQMNNALLMRDISIKRSKCSFKSFKEEIMSTKAKCAGETKVFALFPYEEQNAELEQDVVLVTGVMMEEYRRDPHQPIQVTGTDAEMHQQRLDALKPYYKYHFIGVYVPVTSNYMFDLTVSNVPQTAIKHVKQSELAPRQEDPECMPIGLDPSAPFISPEDIAKMATEESQQ